VEWTQLNAIRYEKAQQLVPSFSSKNFSLFSFVIYYICCTVVVVVAAAAVAVVEEWRRRHSLGWGEGFTLGLSSKTQPTNPTYTRHTGERLSRMVRWE
jgi:hypothetical protein